MTSLGAIPSQYLHIFTNLEALQTPLVRIFLGVHFDMHVWFNHWLLVITSISSPSPLEVRGWGWKFQSSNHMVGSPGYHLPSWGYPKPRANSHLVYSLVQVFCFCIDLSGCLADQVVLVTFFPLILVLISSQWVITPILKTYLNLHFFCT